MSDILINDILDTEKQYIEYCKNLGVRVVNFEILEKEDFMQMQ